MSWSLGSRPALLVGNDALSRYRPEFCTGKPRNHGTSFPVTRPGLCGPVWKQHTEPLPGTRP